MNRLAALGLEDPTIDEFLRNPSLRTITSFFVGWVFVASISYLINTPAIQFLRHRLHVAIYLFRAPKEENNDYQEYDQTDEKQPYPAREWFIETLLGSNDRNADPLNLVLVLNIFTAFSSLSIFFSLLTFDTNPTSNGAGLCAFATAWGGLTSQAIRLTGLLRLSLDLKSLFVRKWELFAFWFVLLGLVVIMFVWGAIGNGVLLSVPQMEPHGLCYRRHFLLTAVLSHTLSILLEGYLIIRMVTILVPSFLNQKHKLRGILDIRIARAASLLLLDILTMVPAAHSISIPADYIPFSIGTLIVLAVFNYDEARALAKLTRTDSIPSTRMLELDRTPISSSGYLTRKTTYSTIPPRVPSKSSANGYVRSNKLRRVPTKTTSSAHTSPRIVVGESPLMQAATTLSRIESRAESLTLQTNGAARQRPDPVVRHIMPHQSIYLHVENRNSIFPSEVPPEFPMPPPIFPLPPPRAVLPRLHVEIPEQDQSGSTASTSRPAQSGTLGSSLTASQLPSAAYGSDIVNGEHIRDLTVSQSAVQDAQDSSGSFPSPPTARTNDTWKRGSRSSSQFTKSSVRSLNLHDGGGTVGIGPLSAVGGGPNSTFKSPISVHPRNSLASNRRVSFQPNIGYLPQFYGASGSLMSRDSSMLFVDTFLDIERGRDTNLLSPPVSIGRQSGRMRLAVSPKGPRSPANESLA